MSSRSLMLLKHIIRPLFWAFWAGAPLGGFLGYLLLSRMDRPTWLFGLVALVLLYVVFKPKNLPEVRLRNRGFFVLGAFVACAGCLIGAAGPFISPFFARTDLRKESIIATRAACQISVNLIKLPVFLSLSFDYTTYAQWMVCMAAAVVIGNKIGTMLLQNVSNEKFVILTKVAMFGIAMRLIYKSAPIYWSLANTLWTTPPPAQVQIVQEPVGPTPVSVAKGRESAEVAWERVKDSAHSQEFMDFLVTYPGSRFAFAALMRFRQLEHQRLLQVQTRLQEAGFDPGPVDGAFGPQTQAALRHYQQSHGLPVTGRLDAATLEMLQITNHATK